MTRLLESENDAGKLLEEMAAALTDNYLPESNEISVFREEKFRDPNGFNFDLNAFSQMGAARPKPQPDWLFASPAALCAQDDC